MAGSSPCRALHDLLKADEEVSRLGAQTGSQWSKLNSAILKARATLAAAPAAFGDGKKAPYGPTFADEVDPKWPL